MALLTTKLLAPPPRAQLVERPRLVELLNEGLAQRRLLTLISAPPGFGKTTLAAEWRQSRGCSEPFVAFAWLALDESDNDPARFLAYLIAAFQQIDPMIGAAAVAMLQANPPSPPDALLASLVNDLAATPRPFVLVLDDYHLIQTPAIHQALGFLLAHQPVQMHLVIVTREDPPLPLARLRARGQVTDVRQADLKFTDLETAGFLRQTMSLDLSAADSAALCQRTEGWIAGLQLAALSMRQMADVSRFVAGLDGVHRYILDYLIEEVLMRQPPDIRDFLMKTAILDRLTAGLCDAVTGRDDSRRVLERLDQSNLFLVGLDESREWYRFHRLFRDLLRAQRGSLDVKPLHLEAARWLEANGWLDDAMTHALAAEAWDEAERLLASAATDAINNGMFATLGHWLDALPQERLRSSADVAALKAWVCLATGQFDAAKTWTDLADELASGSVSGFSRAMVLTLLTYLASLRSDLPRVVDLARQTLTLLAESDPHGLRGAALSNLASAEMAMGDIPGATRSFRELARLGVGSGRAISAVTALVSLAWLEHLQGRAREALALATRALGLSVDARGNRLPLAANAHLVLGRIHYDLDDLAQARDHLVSGVALSKQVGLTSGAMEATFVLGRVQWLTGDLEAAQATVADLRRTVQQLNLPMAEKLAAAGEADFQLALGNAEAAARWAAESGLSADDTPSLPREAEYLTLARALLAQERPAEARALLDRMEAYARGLGLVRTLITVDVLRSLAHLALGARREAVTCLEEAVRLAAPEGYRRAFLDEGKAVLALLPGVRRVDPRFVDSLLDGALEGAARPRQTLAEPLSERELEVLRHLAGGLSNQQMAERLYISVGTVKTHVHNICGKLGAASRTQAVALARELDLL